MVKDLDALEDIPAGPGPAALNGELVAVEADTDPSDDGPRYGYIEWKGEKFGVYKKPSALGAMKLQALNSKLRAAANTKREAAVMRVLEPWNIAVTDFVTNCLGDEYYAFEEHFNATSPGDLEEFEDLSEVVAMLMEKTTGRPKDLSESSSESSATTSTPSSSSPSDAA